MVDRTETRRERELNAALEAIYFGFRALTASPDARLAGLGYSRVHHRILFFIGRNPDCSINELLSTMQVTKQYLHGPLRRLVHDKYVVASVDPEDRRIKRLRLTRRGAGLETQLSGDQRESFEQVFDKAGPQAEAGWRKVMALLAESAEGKARGD
ncbi:MAG: MarR family winged helix-turn-helix transcriptional regulator [Gammaproteobacteria bacterium]